MKTVVDLAHYRNTAGLELCLSLVEDALKAMKAKHYDLAESHLENILDTFDDKHLSSSNKKERPKNNTHCTNITQYRHKKPQ